MGGMNSILRAFMQGQSEGTERLQQAEGLRLREEQLAQQAKQFDAQLKQQERQYKMQQELFNLNRQARVEELKNEYLQQFASGLRKPTGTAVTIPGTNTMDPQSGEIIPGTPRAAQLNDPTQIIESALGPIPVEGFTTPEEIESREFSKFTKRETVKAQNAIDKITTQYEGQLRNIQEKANRDKERLEMQLETNKEIASWKLAMQERLTQERLAMAELRATNKLQERMFNWGFASEQDMQETAEKNADAIEMAEMDWNEIPASGPMRSLTQQALNTRNATVPRGGKKFGQEIHTVSGKLQKVLTEFDDVLKDVGTSSRLSGQVERTIKAKTPVLNWYTDIGRKLSAYRASIIEYAQMKGLTMRGYDSDKEKAIQEATMIQPSDDPTILNDKRLGLVDIGLTVVQSNLNTLKNKDQKIKFWKKIMRDNPNIFGDRDFDKIRGDILETGNYHSSMLTPLKRTNRVPQVMK